MIQVRRSECFPRCLEICHDELRPKDEMDIERIKVTCKSCPYFDRKGHWENEDNEYRAEKRKFRKAKIVLSVEDYIGVRNGRV